jgi:hypothetical protein
MIVANACLFLQNLPDERWRNKRRGSDECDDPPAGRTRGTAGTRQPRGTGGADRASHTRRWDRPAAPGAAPSRASLIFSSHYRFRLCLREWAAVRIRCAGTRACGDDGRRGCRLAVVERCGNRTLFMASAEDPGKFRTTVYKTEQLCCASRSTAYLECLRRV